MKLQILAACAALVTFSAGSALAGDPVTAKLASPVAEKTKFIAGGAIFLCEGDTCIAQAPTSQTFAAATCKAIAKNAGAVQSFANARKSFEADKLDACNVAAGSNTQVAKR